MKNTQQRHNTVTNCLLLTTAKLKYNEYIKNMIGTYYTKQTTSIKSERQARAKTQDKGDQPGVRSVSVKPRVTN